MPEMYQVESGEQLISQRRNSSWEIIKERAFRNTTMLLFSMERGIAYVGGAWPSRIIKDIFFFFFAKVKRLSFYPVGSGKPLKAFMQRQEE